MVDTSLDYYIPLKKKKSGLNYYYFLKLKKL